MNNGKYVFYKDYIIRKMEEEDIFGSNFDVYHKSHNPGKESDFDMWLVETIEEAKELIDELTVGES